MIRPPSRHPGAHRRRGAAYVLVLSTTLVVLTIVLGSLALVRTARAEAFDTLAAQRAAAMSRSGLDLLAARISTDFDDWRDRIDTAQGAGSINVAFAGGTLRLRAVDPNDDDLEDEELDEVELVSRAEFAGAVRTTAVRASMIGTALPILSSALHARSGLGFTNATFTSPAIVTCNANVVANSSRVDARVVAFGSVTGSEYQQSTRQGQPALDTPDGDDVVDYYAAIGQAIPYASIPGGSIEKVELARGATTFGTLITNDVVTIECGGRPLSISNARLAVTLVVLNTSRLTIGVSVDWANPVHAMPMVVCDGPITISPTGASLMESKNGMSFNTIIPDETGATDSDRKDSYPALLRGLIFSNSAISIEGNTNMVGVAIAEAIAVSGNASIEPDDTLATHPPPMFQGAPRIVLQRATFRRVVD